MASKDNLLPQHMILSPSSVENPPGCQFFIFNLFQFYSLFGFYTDIVDARRKKKLNSLWKYKHTRKESKGHLSHVGEVLALIRTSTEFKNHSVFNRDLESCNRMYL